MKANRMAGMLLLMGAVLTSGAQAAEMEPVGDIEALWDIEDSHTESAEPLVTILHNGDERLGYDAAGNTFYCSITSAGGEWPELAITSGDDDLRLIWADDYAYDSCADALENGTAYQAMAVSETSYAYFNIVFTGMPIVVIDSAEAIEEEYVPCTVDIAGGGYEPMHSAALTHLRAGGPVHEFPKLSYRLEFHKTGKNGKDKKSKVSVMGMPGDSDWLLIGSPKDELCVRNELGWKLWNSWNEGTDYQVPLQGRMTETFVQNEYIGLHFLMQRIRVNDELKRVGGDPEKDCAFRFIHSLNIGDKPVLRLTDKIETLVELRQKPDSVTEEEAFSQFDDFVLLSLGEEDERYLSDEEFTEMALRYLDIREQVNLYLFIQSLSLDFDNVHNNVYVWMVHEADGNLRMHFSPWDLDMTLEDCEYNPWMSMTERLLDLNVGGAREILWEIWNREQAATMSEENLTEILSEIDAEINNSGAFLRETAKWQIETGQLDLVWTLKYAVSHQKTVEEELTRRWPLN